MHMKSLSNIKMGENMIEKPFSFCYIYMNLLSIKLGTNMF